MVVGTHHPAMPGRPTRGRSRAPLEFRAMETGLVIIALFYLALSISAIVNLFLRSGRRTRG